MNSKISQPRRTQSHLEDQQIHQSPKDFHITSWYTHYGKRSLDILLSFVALSILLPAIALIGFGVLVTSGRPILFRQTRTGRYGYPFTLYKFRTMSLDPVNPSQFDLGSSARVTPLGRWLRDWKLDELPQFFNVLRGDMSLVGPRPEVPRWTMKYPDKWGVVLSQRPGITDHASIYFRNEESLLASSTDPSQLYENSILPLKLKMNIRYVRDINFMADVKILYDTINNVLTKAKKVK